jgi:histidinol-phosphatase (PHP family)
VLDLQFQYRGRINVLLGLEMDYVPGMETDLQRQAQAYPWDYLIGSIHYLDPECRIGAWSRNLPLEADEHYVQYYRLVQQLIRSGLYDIIGHLDVVKRSGRLPGPRAAAELETTLVLAAQHQCCLEINTSGYRHTDAVIPGSYPSLDIAGRMLELGLVLVVNSDAHAPEQVGLNFATVERWLQQQGCRNLARFNRRRRELHPLSA